MAEIERLADEIMEKRRRERAQGHDFTRFLYKMGTFVGFALGVSMMALFPGREWILVFSAWFFAVFMGLMLWFSRERYN